jgi:8-amino-7-oxononanoate synthase
MTRRPRPTKPAWPGSWPASRSCSWTRRTTNVSGFPLVELAIADPADLDAVGRLLFDRGIYVTLAPYPVVARKEAGFRVQVTVANTSEQLETLCSVLDEVDDRFGFCRPHP